jgi:hypothetical protein
MSDMANDTRNPPMDLHGVPPGPDDTHAGPVTETAYCAEPHSPDKPSPEGSPVMVLVTPSPRSPFRREAGKRLMNARRRAGFASARAFADHCGANLATYYQHENGIRPVTDEAAALYARHLGIAPAEISFAAPMQIVKNRRIIIGSIGANLAVSLYDDPQDREETVPRLDETGDLNVLAVHGDDNYPFVENGDEVEFRPLAPPVDAELHGIVCVVQLAERPALLVRRVMVQHDGRYTLLAFNGAPPMINIALEQASPVLRINKHQAVRLQRQRVA